MNYRKTLLAVSIISSLCVSGAIYAQDSSQADTTLAQQRKAKADEVKTLNTVVVTGIRGAVEKALDIKRDANANIDVVTAEDVGKLPAHNVADTLQRLPGVNISSASADEGGFDEADRVSLRGTSPSLTQTTINGHAVGSADWFVLSQGSNMGRSVSYTLLPSELVSRVEVHKSSEARVMDGGTTGSVDIITRKPLDFAKQFTTNLTVGGVHSTTAGKTDPQLSGLFNYKNAEGTFGVMVQLFKQKRSLQREAQELPAGFTAIAPGSALATSNPDLSGVRVPSLLGSTLFTQVRDRKGGLIDVQFRPSNNLTLDFNGFRSDMTANNYNRNFMLWGGNFATTQAPQPGYTVKDNVLTQATYAGVPGTNYVVYDMISREATSKSSYYTADADWQATDSLNVKFQVGTTKGTGETSAQYIAEVTAANGGGASWTSHGIDAPVDWNVGGDISPAGVTSFGTWGNQQVKAIDKENWGTVDFTQDFNTGVLSSVNYGLRYAKHDREVQSPEGASPGNIWPALQNGATGNYPSDFASSIGGNFPTNVWYFTPGALKSAITANSTWLSNDDGPTGRHNYGAEYAVDEKNLAAYFQANFEGDNWSGNVGLRYVNIKQDIDTYFAAAAPTVPDVSSLFGAWTRLNTRNSYSRALPSANLKFNLASDVLFRFAASQTQTLPDYSALGASSWGSDLSKTGGGGNTHLKPVLSTNFDAGIEWYFMPRGLLSATAYSMNMKDYVAYGVQTQMLYSELTHQLEAYQVTMPVNADAKVSGVEMAYSQPLGQYFGFDANYTYADGSSAFTWSDGSHNLLGTSKNTYNVGAYFENAKFGARLSYTARSAFLIGLSGASPYYQDKFGTLSASLSYKATDWLSFSLDALNLNNPTYKYYETVNIPHAFYSNGRQYYLNAHLSF